MGFKNRLKSSNSRTSSWSSSGLMTPIWLKSWRWSSKTSSNFRAKAKKITSNQIKTSSKTTSTNFNMSKFSFTPLRTRSFSKKSTSLKKNLRLKFINQYNIVSAFKFENIERRRNLLHFCDNMYLEEEEIRWYQKISHRSQYLHEVPLSPFILVSYKI